VGVDEPAADGPIPLTMQAYEMQGTPTLVLIDAQGRLRRQVFGVHDDLLLGAELATLFAEVRSPPQG
ncbi:MAG: TlpA family protein disulfide reductase, partial [Burkholderiales bacterium]|nr:TlpA family protein disulfide reductase [Burkholderiales bacterium]